MAAPGISSKGPQSIAEWLPLLGSILQALSGMAEDDRAEDDRAEDDRIAERSPAAAREVDTRSNETAR